MMLCELKLPKLSVTTFRLSAAHKILEVRQLGKQPRSQPKLRGGTCWAPNAVCALHPSAPAAEGLLSQCLSPGKCYSVSGGNIAAVLMSFFFSLLYICFPPKVAKSGRSEFSPGGDIAESAIILLGTGWQSMIFRLFFFLLAYRFPGQRTG